MRAKKAFSTRNVPAGDLRCLSTAEGIKPQSGDLVLARVEKIGNHKGLQLDSGRRAELYAGDEIIVAYGDRYAPDQYEAEIPDHLGPCHLVAAGGLASIALSWSARVSAPTSITPIGLLTKPSGDAINIRDYALPTTLTPAEKLPPVIAIVGSSMNAGKTTTCAGVIHGLARAGHRVGAAKLTGTGAFGDLWSMKDAGAEFVLDFTDAGYVSTYKAPVEGLRAASRTLISRLAELGATVIVVEIADGVLQQETAALIRSKDLSELVCGYVFAADGSTGAAAGVRWLKDHGRVLGVSGRVTMSPLAMRETECETGVSCHTLQDLTTKIDPTWLVRPEPRPETLGLPV